MCLGCLPCVLFYSITSLSPCHLSLLFISPRECLMLSSPLLTTFLLCLNVFSLLPDISFVPLLHIFSLFSSPLFFPCHRSLALLSLPLLSPCYFPMPCVIYLYSIYHLLSAPLPFTFLFTYLLCSPFHLASLPVLLSPPSSYAVFPH